MHDQQLAVAVHRVQARHRAVQSVEPAEIENAAFLPRRRRGDFPAQSGNGRVAVGNNGG
jgi:hypothetical protein